MSEEQGSQSNNIAVACRDDFAKRRRRSRLSEDNSETTAEDCILNAHEYLEEYGSSGRAIVVIEKSSGGIVMLTSSVTAAEYVYLLERAKLQGLQG